jgi:GDP/UDP-N,N'-diacetylbacillosamine 2-epimerase (hydrolysing)
MKICIVTGTRAEYGLLYWTIKKLLSDKYFQVQLVVTGMHLSPEFGLTYKQIEEDGIKINKKVEMLLSSDSASGVSKSIGLGIICFADIFSDLKPDIVLLLGDRFEIFAAATAAMIAKTPIAHCHGGEATEGLIDEPIRHSITKMSHLHFTSTEEYRKRVIQLGEQPNRVFNVGALGIENINKLKLLNKIDFENSIDLKLSSIVFLITFHPVTLEKSTAEEQFKNLLLALKTFKNTTFIFTLPNADNDGRIIIDLIHDFVSKNKNISKAYTSLGQLRYLSAIKHSDLVIGNSSSGLIEVPSFKKPTINIGDRQRGRVFGPSVINCKPIKKEIINSIEIALSKKFNQKLLSTKNPYGSRNSSIQIVRILKKVSIGGDLVKKRFYNLSQ